ncbi:MAG: carboxypeptidase-like regulatory domain-containing protein [Chitinophagaceae bacterium]|nr:carboxypeptidase-like regulatory domain-containing protein [Chitinophagaceae bacterium]
MFVLCWVKSNSAFAQPTYRVSGFVYDSSRNYPLEAVSVISSSGKGTTTNSDGHYMIEVTEKDSIWFSYLGKPTMKFPVLKMANPLEFDISLQVSVPTLKEVKIKPRNYRFDSMQNRQDYAKIFNYQKPRLKTVTPQYGTGVGFDLDEIINMFRFKRNRSIASFQQRLLLEEQDKFIDHRFNKALVRRLTLLTGTELDSFMRIWRPSYTFTKAAGEYEFQYYIKEAYYRFKHSIKPEALRPEEE